jgi:protein disulfide-isomerase A6
MGVPLLLVALAGAKVLDLTADNINHYVGASKGVFVKFYSPNCPHCKDMAPHFEEASDLHSDIPFGALDCTAHSKVCDVHKVNGWPTLKLFKPDSTVGIEFRGDHSPAQYSEFIERHTSSKSSRIPSKLVSLSPIGFQRFTNGTGCALVLFFDVASSHKTDVVEQMKDIAEIFDPDTNVSVASLNCERFREQCDGLGITSYPKIQVAKSGGWSVFSGYRSLSGIIEFVNKKCGTERTDDGLLNANAGRIAEADAIVAEFLAVDEKGTVIEKMRKVVGAEFYVKAMERYVAKGKDQIQKDVEVMREMLDARQGSMKALDGMKRRYNIFMRFLPPEGDEEPELADLSL